MRRRILWVSHSRERRWPRRIFWAAIAGGLVVAGSCGDDGPTGRDGRTIEVEVVDFRFEPDTVDARIGDTIRWIQRDEVLHTVTSIDPAPDEPAGFDEPLDEVGDVVEVELSRAGTIDYFCRPHPFMLGAIVVAP